MSGGWFGFAPVVLCSSPIAVETRGFDIGDGVPTVWGDVAWRALLNRESESPAHESWGLVLPLLHLIVGVEHGAALHAAGLAAGLADQGLLAAFAVLPLLALLIAVVVSRLLLVLWISFVGCGLTAAALAGRRGWWVAGCRHRGPVR